MGNSSINMLPLKYKCKCRRCFGSLLEAVAGPLSSYKYNSVYTALRPVNTMLLFTQAEGDLAEIFNVNEAAAYCKNLDNAIRIRIGYRSGHVRRSGSQDLAPCSCLYHSSQITWLPELPKNSNAACVYSTIAGKAAVLVMLRLRVPGYKKQQSRLKWTAGRIKNTNV